LKEQTPSLGKVDAFAKLESVVVGDDDDDLGAVHMVDHVAGNKFVARVVAVGVIRLEHDKL
jgi:hypothetical protein